MGESIYSETDGGAKSVKPQDENYRGWSMEGDLLLTQGGRPKGCHVGRDRRYSQNKPDTIYRKSPLIRR